MTELNKIIKNKVKNKEISLEVKLEDIIILSQSIQDLAQEIYTLYRQIKENKENE